MEKIETTGSQEKGGKNIESVLKIKEALAKVFGCTQVLCLKDGLIFTHYKNPQKKSNKVIIVGIGAPNITDAGFLRNAPMLVAAGYDVIVPEYEGFCRSSGVFSPENSVTSLGRFEYWCSEGTNVQEVYSGDEHEIQYNKRIYLGLSYGGSVVPLLPKYYRTIDTLACFYPVLSFSDLGKNGFSEETPEDFLNAVRRGFLSQYRGILGSEWKDVHFRDLSSFIPTQQSNIDALNGVNMFLAHGTNDSSIHHTKTETYFTKLKGQYPDQNIVYEQFPGREHGLETMLPATEKLIAWLDNMG